ncbi:hypothetical protein DPMN_169481 [Dreissena polymorpha]|uniref:Uncharacterized protein n=1 Tax=Dreissena polymorpha TaxID=45954 RepID=A0A9D4DXV2_DREPO|nr:hypothetical protein DPMN_169481 [Dreissena polymorpha]
MSIVRNHEDCQELPWPQYAVTPVCEIMMTARSFHVRKKTTRGLVVLIAVGEAPDSNAVTSRLV